MIINILSLIQDYPKNCGLERILHLSPTAGELMKFCGFRICDKAVVTFTFERSFLFSKVFDDIDASFA